MPRGSACHYDYAVAVQEFIFVVVYSVEPYGMSAVHHTSAYAVGQCDRLFENFFEHEVWIAAFFELGYG